MRVQSDLALHSLKIGMPLIFRRIIRQSTLLSYAAVYACWDTLDVHPRDANNLVGDRDIGPDLTAYVHTGKETNDS